MSEDATLITAWSHDVSVGGYVQMVAGEDGTITVHGGEVLGPEPDHIIDAVRGAAWAEMGVPRNPIAALYQHAQCRGLGAPLSPEFDFTWQGRLYRVQCYAMGIVYCEVGKWDQVQAVLW